MVEKKETGKTSAPKKVNKTVQYKQGKFCPKCGAGVKLAEHRNRRSCGKCGYFERK
ncbi:MAG: 30S ribosomal protein S27ae [Candidatus Micrarchaeota archaeon]